MKLVAVDAASLRPKNVRVTIDELRRVGRKLRGLRTERGLRQADVVADKKSGGLSIGTLQAIEGAWYEVRDTNVDKYARYFGTTREQLLADGPPVAAADPLLDGLHEEHLDIARRWMRARNRVRAAVEHLLSSPAHEDQLAQLVLTLAGAPPERLALVAAWLATDERTLQLVERVRARLRDPNYPAYAALIEGGLTLTTQPTPKVDTQTRTTKGPTRRA